MARARYHSKDSVSEAALSPSLSQHHQNGLGLCKRTMRYVWGDGGGGVIAIAGLFLNSPLDT